MPGHPTCVRIGHTGIAEAQRSGRRMEPRIRERDELASLELAEGPLIERVQRLFNRVAREAALPELLSSGQIDANLMRYAG